MTTLNYRFSAKCGRPLQISPKFSQVVENFAKNDIFADRGVADAMPSGIG